MNGSIICRLVTSTQLLMWILVGCQADSQAEWQISDPVPKIEQSSIQSTQSMMTETEYPRAGIPEATLDASTVKLHQQIDSNNLFYLFQEGDSLSDGCDELQISPDGKTISTYIHKFTSDSKITIYSLSTGNQIELVGFELENLDRQKMTFSPDGSKLVFGKIAGATQSIYEYDTITKNVRLIEDIDINIFGTALTYDSDGNLLKIPADVKAPGFKGSLDTQRLVGYWAWSPDMQKLAMLFMQGRIYLWNLQDENQSGSWLDSDEAFDGVGVTFDEDTHELIWARQVRFGGAIEILNSQGDLVGSIQISEYPVKVKWLLGGKILAVIRNIPEVYFYRPDGQVVGLIFPRQGDRYKIMDLAISPDRSKMYVCSKEGLFAFSVQNPDQ